jgi:glutamine synthetase
LMTHALGGCLLGTPTVNGYGRYQPMRWHRRVCAGPRRPLGCFSELLGKRLPPALKIASRALGEPYLYMASQAIAGLGGIEGGLTLRPRRRAVARQQCRATSARPLKPSSAMP